MTCFSLLTIRTRRPKFHAVVFSQFTSFLDLMETALKQAKLRFVRLDGTMDRKSRDAAVKQFNNKERHCVFIISLKAGGTGLNLVRILYVTDWWWSKSTATQTYLHKLILSNRPSHRRSSHRPCSPFRPGTRGEASWIWDLYEVLISLHRSSFIASSSSARSKAR